mmetsp:Transcript_136711/g.424724  ORF Transcript_136711/g.424724 Transcript_136711/m.424724 type:complete len:117 (-) Transcript_136711:15-365(-)
MQRDSADAEQEAAALMHERVLRVLDVFARHGARDIVLGAWGCGVFGNDPSTVAGIFRDKLLNEFRGRFRKVVFAVLDARMAAVFAREFEVEVVPPGSEGSKWGAQKQWGRCPGEGP